MPLHQENARIFASFIVRYRIYPIRFVRLCATDPTGPPPISQRFQIFQKRLAVILAQIRSIFVASVRIPEISRIKCERSDAFTLGNSRIFQIVPAAAGGFVADVLRIEFPGPHVERLRPVLRGKEERI